MLRLSCSNCRYFQNDPDYLEKVYPGLNTLSSAWGCVRGDAGLCIKHDVYLFPRGKCGDFSLNETASAADANPYALVN